MEQKKPSERHPVLANHLEFAIHSSLVSRNEPTLRHVGHRYCQAGAGLVSISGYPSLVVGAIHWFKRRSKKR